MRSCESLIDGLALCVAVKVEISLDEDPVEAPPVPPPLPVPAPVPAPPIPPPPSLPPPSLPPPSLPPRKRSIQLVVGLDGIFTPLIAPSASAGFALWAVIDVLNIPLTFELDLRSTWSFVPARVPLAYQPLFALRASYVSGVLAGCWRGPVSVCPMLEVGSMSFSKPGTIGEAISPSILAAAGGRLVYARPIVERFVLRGLFEVEGVFHPFSISDDMDYQASIPSPVSFAWGVGFGGSL